jgi:hypothetical protein
MQCFLQCSCLARLLPFYLYTPPLLHTGFPAQAQIYIAWQGPLPFICTLHPSYTQAFQHKLKYTYTHTYIHTHERAHLSTQTHTHGSTYTHTDAQTHKYIHILQLAALEMLEEAGVMVTYDIPRIDFNSPMHPQLRAWTNSNIARAGGPRQWATAQSKVSGCVCCVKLCVRVSVCVQYCVCVWV